MDFFNIAESREKDGSYEIWPVFAVGRIKDLMVRGRAFYGVWDESAGLWSTDEYSVVTIVDDALYEYSRKIEAATGAEVHVKYLRNFNNGMWTMFKNYVSRCPDNSHQLDEKLTFADTDVSRNDYVSKRLPYSLDPNGKYESWDELVGTLYDKEEREKIEWAIGAILSGDSVKIQKFLVLYGDAGAGKSTILNVIQLLFAGYYATFDAKALGMSANAFSTEAFKDNPLVAIQHDGDLSRIEDNTKLNAIVSHEDIMINEKYKSSYPMSLKCMLLMATNRPVKITDAKSGIIRRLIDVEPNGNRIEPNRYQSLVDRIPFELGAIANHCLEEYRKMGRNYYSSYRAIKMLYKTDVFFNFIEDSYDTFATVPGVTLRTAYEMYKAYCQESGATYELQMYKFREELKNYFHNYEDRVTVDGKDVRKWYSGFNTEKFAMRKGDDIQDPPPYSLTLESEESILDELLADCPAQYANEKGTPENAWAKVETTLKDIDTSRMHYVKVPRNHIVIDFDLRDSRGRKSYEENVREASKFPPTYAELSKSGKGVHLHYIYEGDPNKLSAEFAPNIEVKTFKGKAALRRRLTACNSIPVARISTGLPLREDKGKVISAPTVKTENGLRRLIRRNLRKEIHPGTKPSVDFIGKILEDAYSSGMVYDVNDMRTAVLAFANNSTHHSADCVKAVGRMKFASENENEDVTAFSDEMPIVFYDVEVFPNLFVLVWKTEGGSPVKMINPTPMDIEDILKYRLVGFNNKRYDNHILYGRMIGYDNQKLYDLSQRIVSGDRNAMFREAYNLSYTDIYDFTSKKQSLKKYEIELGIHHQELGFPWDKPVDEDKWELVADYCVNDVIATEATWNARHEDFVAREILADLSGLTVNASTNQHTTKIIFGDERHPVLEYPDISEEFPDYEFKDNQNWFRGEEVGFGGCVRSKPGYYTDVCLLDVESQHPHSIIAMNLFGKYTKKFLELVNSRISIKHHDYGALKGLFDGKLEKYLTNDDDADVLSKALKIPINSVYGLTSAPFDNPFKDPRNKNNIVALRGALFMLTLRDEIEKRGFEVVHIKTDSVKIPNATEEIISFAMDFAKKYGYRFEHEATYSKMCLVNDAVYIAKYADGKHAGEWTAVGAEFQVPYVFKKLFSKEPVEFEDYCNIRSVKTAMYLDMNEGLLDGEHDYQFIGKTGSFVPILPGMGGGELLREKEGKYYAVGGTKGYRWLESEVVQKMEKVYSVINTEYAENMAKAAVEHISEFCDYNELIS